MNNTQYWYVIQSNPRKEHSIYKQLCAKSIGAYYPTIRVNPVNPRASRVRPFFPGYLFAQVDLEEDDVGTIHRLPGVKRLVEQNGEPVLVTDRIIRELEWLVAGIDKGEPLDVEHLRQGSLVQITGGLLAGHEVLFDMRFSGPERVQVLLSLAGHHNTE